MGEIEFILEYAKASLEATIHCEAILSHRQDSNHEPTDHNCFWIRHGRSLKVEIYYGVEGSALKSSSFDSLVVAELQDALQSAQLWTQLGLEVSSHYDWTTTQRDDDMNLGGKPDLSAVFQPIHRTAATGRPAARLLNGMPFKDTRQPTGMDTATMQGIRLHIDLGRKKGRKLGCGHKGIVRPNEQEDEEMLDEGLFYGEDLDSLPCPLTTQTPRKAHETEAFITDKPIGEDLSINILLGFLDGALRGSIHQQPMRLMPGLKARARSKSQKKRSCLFDLSAIVWSPNGLSTIAERACYVPTISRTLTDYLERSKTSKSQVLRERITDDNPKNSRTLRQRCEVLLWNEMSDALNKDKSSRSLKPLRVMRDEPDPLVVEEDEMLLDDPREDWQKDFESVWLDAIPMQYAQEMAEEDDLLWEQDDELVVSQDSGYRSAVSSQLSCSQEPNTISDMEQGLDEECEMYIW